MGKAKDISPEKVREIETLLRHTTHSQRQVAVIAKVSRATVDRIKKKIDSNTDLRPNRKNRCGRKKEQHSVTKEKFETYV